MKLATFNIYWLGNDRFIEMSKQSNLNLKKRDANDWLSIARVISKLDADVIVFEEIVSLDELQKVLNHANGLTSRTYQTHDQGQLLGTGGAADQKVVIAYDEQKYKLVAASPIFGGKGRLPFGLRVRSVTGGEQILVLGVHFKSGQPLFDDKLSAIKREAQCQHIADWVAGKKVDLNPVLPQPDPDELVAILGDFNAISELESGYPGGWQIIVDSLNPLREQHMKEWWWEKPLADPAGGDRSTSYIEHLLIDFVMLSPSLKNRIVRPPTIYAYDKDPSITSNAQKGVKYYVSDHRPVYVEVDASS